MGEKMNEYLDDFVPCLQNILKDQDLERRIKLPALHALGDLSMYSGDMFNNKFLASTLDMLQQAARASVIVADLDDDTKEFLVELREVIIDQYIVILMSAGDTNHLASFNPYLESIFGFVEATAQIEGTKNVKVLKLIIALVGDIATQFKDNQGVK